MLNARRPTVSVFIACSLDGFIARTDGRIDWLDLARLPGGEDYGYARFTKTVTHFVIGRGTHDAVAQFPEWPYGDKPVVVVTHRPVTTLPHAASCFSGRLVDLIDNLGAHGALRIYLDGGSLISQALRENLIDELTISWLPILLGDGLRLFNPPLPESRWRLVRSEAYESGVVQTEHRRLPDTRASM